MAKLSNINGKFAVEDTGAIRFSDQTGTTGQILKSNGNSAPTWVDPNTVGTGPWLPLAGGIVSGSTTFQSSLTVGGTVTGQGGVNITGTNNTTSTLTLTNTAPTPDNSWSLVPQYNSQDLHLLEDTTTQVTFKSGGNVGIGTDSPDALLDLESATPALRITDTDSNAPYELKVDGGTFSIKEVSNSRTLMSMTTGAVITLDSLGSNTVLNTSGSVVVPNGSVGIGTTSPDATLDVHAPSTTAPSLTMGAAAGQIFKNEDLEFAFGLNNASPYNGWMQTRFAGNASRSFSINPLGGNVGIGTDSPDSILHVNGYRLRLGDGASDSKLWGTPATGGSFLIGQSSSTGKIKFVSSTDSNLMTILNGGNVGIGTDSPTGKLVVRTSTDHNFEVEETGGELRLSALNNARSANIGLQFAASEFNFLTGNVGIGTTTPDSILHVNGYRLRLGDGASDSKLWGTPATGGSFLIGQSSSTGKIKFVSSTDSNLMTILNGGNVGIGTDSPEFKLDVKSNSDAAPSAYLRGGKSSQGEIQNTGLIIGTQTDMAAGDYQGISFTGYTSSSAIARGRAAIGVEAINGPGKMDLVFMTRFADDGTQLSSADEKMRITSAGEFGFGTTTNSVQNGSIYFQEIKDVNTYIKVGHKTGSASGADFLACYYDGTQIGGVAQAGTTGVAFNTSSDYRLKENVVSMTGALDRISQLKPSRFNFIADADKTVDGFLAHEVQEIVPEAITGEKDAVDEEGNPQYQGIDQSKLVPLLVGAIQELKAEIELLKNK